MKTISIKEVVVFVMLLLLPVAGLLAADLNLVNPNANAETKCLYNYMLSIYKTKTLAGQDTAEDSQWLKDTTGKYPALAGFDFTYMTSWPQANGGYNTGDVDKAIAWHEAGGIVQFQWHWYAPTDNVGCWYKAFYKAPADCGGTNFDVSAAINAPGSAKYNMLVTDIDMVAAQLKRLQDAGVPVLFRPLHEAEGGWFWWGAKGADACKKLYYLVYDRLTNYHHLNNIIWVWTINCCSTSLSGNAQYWYPGNDKVDINGVDLYLSCKDYQTADGLFNQVEAASGYRKMAAITEGGTVPNAGSKWIWFSTWNGTSFIRNTNCNEPWHNTSVFNDAQVITRDELNISCGPTLTMTITTTPSYTPTPYPIQGKIEAENYKSGADGIAYHDTDAVNEKGEYRNDGVDVEACTDVGGGYNVAQIEATEWMAYSVNVLSSGTYNMTVRVASLGVGGTLHVTFGGVTKGGTLTIPDTGGWQTWQDVTVPVELTAGVQEMRLIVDTVNVAGLLGNINYINFTAIFTSTATQTNTTQPTGTFTWTRTATPTWTCTRIMTGTPTSTWTSSKTASPTYTRTETWTRTRTQTFSRTPTMTNTITQTRTLTNTPVITNTRTVTPSFSRTATGTWTQTATNSQQPTNTFTWTKTMTPMWTQTSTWTSSKTASPTCTWTQTATMTASLTFTSTQTMMQTATATTSSTFNVPSSTFTTTNTTTATRTNTMQPTNTFTGTRIVTPTRTQTVTGTVMQTITPTQTQTGGQQFTIDDVLIFPNPYNSDKGDLKISFKVTQESKTMKVKIYTTGFRKIKEIKFVDKTYEAGKTNVLKIPEKYLKDMAAGTYYAIIIAKNSEDAEVRSNPEVLIILK